MLPTGRYGMDFYTHGDGGESGIRTHETLASLHAFQACAFNHSAISPRRNCEAARTIRIRALSATCMGSTSLLAACVS